MNLPSKAEISKMAYNKKLESGIKVSHAYELIAKDYGYKTYAAMLADMKRLSKEVLK